MRNALYVTDRFFYEIILGDNQNLNAVVLEALSDKRKVKTQIVVSLEKRNNDTVIINLYSSYSEHAGSLLVEVGVTDPHLLWHRIIDIAHRCLHPKTTIVDSDVGVPEKIKRRRSVRMGRLVDRMKRKLFIYG